MKYKFLKRRNFDKPEFYNFNKGKSIVKSQNPIGLNKLAVKFLNMILSKWFGKITLNFGKGVRFYNIPFVYGRTYHKDGDFFANAP